MKVSTYLSQRNRIIAYEKTTAELDKARIVAAGLIADATAHRKYLEARMDAYEAMSKKVRRALFHPKWRERRKARKTLRFLAS